jgi:hypothetical protein
VIERGNATRKRVDEAVQLGIGQCPVHVSVSLHGVAVEIARAENNFERKAATIFTLRHGATVSRKQIQLDFFI